MSVRELIPGIAVLTLLLICCPAVFAQRAPFEAGTGMVAGEGTGPQTTYPVAPSPGQTPGVTAVSPFPSGGFPGSDMGASPFGGPFPPGASTGLPETPGSPGILPGSPSGAWGPAYQNPPPTASFPGSGTYGSSFSYPGLSGMSGAIGPSGALPPGPFGVQSAPPVTAETQGTMGRPGGVYGYPAGVPGSPGG